MNECSSALLAALAALMMIHNNDAALWDGNDGLDKARSLTDMLQSDGVCLSEGDAGEQLEKSAVDAAAAAAAKAQEVMTTTTVVFSSAYREMSHMVRCFAPADNAANYKKVEYSFETRDAAVPAIASQDVRPRQSHALTLPIGARCVVNHGERLVGRWLVTRQRDGGTAGPPVPAPGEAPLMPKVPYADPSYVEPCPWCVKETGAYGGLVRIHAGFDDLARFTLVVFSSFSYL